MIAYTKEQLSELNWLIKSGEQSRVPIEFPKECKKHFMWIGEYAKFQFQVTINLSNHNNVYITFYPKSLVPSPKDYEHTMSTQYTVKIAKIWEIIAEVQQ